MPAALHSKRSFLSLCLSQFLGAFNDNAFKQWLLLSAAVGASGGLPIPGGAELVFAAFALPFLVFGPACGALSDRVSKSAVLRGAKSLEIAVMVFASWALVGGHGPALLLAIFAMSTQSAIFGPAKYGALPEMLPPQLLSKGNGWIQATTFAAILLGTAVGGSLFDLSTAGRASLAGVVFVVVAVAGRLAAAGIEHLPAADPNQASRHPWRQLVHAWSHVREDRILVLGLTASALFWLIGSTLLLAVTDLAATGAAAGSAVAMQSCALALGVALGSLAAARLSGERIEAGLIPLGLGLVAVALVLASRVGDPRGLASLLGAAGIGAGLFSVPIRALLQQRPPAHARGSVLGLVETADFAGVFLAAGVQAIAGGLLGLTPRTVIALLGVLSALFALAALCWTIEFTARLLLSMIVRAIYRLRVRGAHHVPFSGGAVLAANHLSYVDAFLVGAATRRRVRFLMHRSFFRRPLLGALARRLGALPIAAEDSREEKMRSLELAAQLASAGELVCIFPEGRISRSGTLLGFRGGLERIARQAQVPIVPVALDGVWGSIFSFAEGPVRRRFPLRLPDPVTVRFGAPLPADSPRHEVRDRVAELIAAGRSEDAQHGATLATAFVRSARRHARRPALRDSTGRALNYWQTLAAASALRARLAPRLGRARTVGVLLPASVGGALANLALALDGRAALNLNFTLGDQELGAPRGPLARAQATAVITSRAFLAASGRSSPVAAANTIFLEDLRVSRGARLLHGFLALCCPPALFVRCASRHPRARDAAAILFSSGSSAEPKGVVLSHANLRANVDSLAAATQLGPHDRVLGALPFFHAFGLNATLWAPLLRGAEVLHHPDPLAAGAIARACAAFPPTVLLATPTFARAWLKRIEPAALARLRLAAVGAERLPGDLAEAWRERFGSELLEGYGCTELAPAVSFNLPASADGEPGHRPGTVGRPLPGIAVRIVDRATHRPLAPGVDGAVLVRGANVMEGYLGDVERTRAVISAGWYDTGDIGSLDEDGFLTLSGRASRFSKIGGEMVSHVRVEEALAVACSRCAPRAECSFAVLGVEDERRGERLIVAHTALPCTLDGLLEAVRGAGLPALFTPRRSDFVALDGLPILGSGKLDLARLGATVRRVLAEREGGEGRTRPLASPAPGDGHAGDRSVDSREHFEVQHDFGVLR